MIKGKQKSHCDLKPFRKLKFQAALVGRIQVVAAYNLKKEHPILRHSYGLSSCTLSWKIPLVLCSVAEEFCNCAPLTILRGKKLIKDVGTQLDIHFCERQ